MSDARPMRTVLDSYPGGLDVEALDRHRRELTRYCHRMLGSGFEADDAVQETMVRAWKALDTFEGRSSVRSWLYRIATNVCLDHLRGQQRRARPVPDERVPSAAGDPAEVVAARAAIRSAFVAALALLPARQRAVLILRDVLRWHAREVAELLDTSVVSVNSALQRARATLAARAADGVAPASPGPADTGHRDLLGRYVDAFERYDLPALVALLHQDANA